MEGHLASIDSAWSSISCLSLGLKGNLSVLVYFQVTGEASHWSLGALCDSFLVGGRPVTTKSTTALFFIYL